MLPSIITDMSRVENGWIKNGDPNNRFFLMYRAIRRPITLVRKEQINFKEYTKKNLSLARGPFFATI